MTTAIRLYRTYILSTFVPLNTIRTVAGFSGAATRIRTGDLILTKDALYRLSYSSIQSPRSFRPAGGDREGT